MRFSILSVVFGLVTAVALSACGGDGGGGASLEDYLEEYNDISGAFSDDAESRSNEFSSDVEGVSDEDELSELLDAFFSDFGELLDDIIADFEDLDPPDEAADLHDAQLEKLQDARDVVDTAQEQLGDASGGDEIGEIAQEFGQELIDLGEELDQDCQDLQEVADDEDIDIELNCAE